MNKLIFLIPVVAVFAVPACETEEGCEPSMPGCGVMPLDGASGGSIVDAAPPDLASPDVDASADTTPTDAADTGCPALTGKVINHGGDLTASETWAGDGNVHLWSSGGSIRPGVTLTLAACAVVHVNPTLSFTLRGAPGNPARLISQGTANKPVLITNVPGSGNWGNILNYDADGTVDLSYTTLENGGAGTFHGSVIDLRAGADPSTTVVPVLRADHVTLRNPIGAGLVLESGAGFSADSTELTVSGGGATAINGGGSALEIGQLAAATLPTLHLVGNAHDQIGIGAGSLSIKRDVTLKNVGAPYYFYFDRVRVFDPAGTATPTLTIAPGVEVRFDDYLMVGEANPGKLIAVGTALQPIVFSSSKLVKAAGDWPGVWLRNAPGSRIENVRIEFAGGFNGIGSSNCKPNNTGDTAALFISGFGSAYIPVPADLVAITIADSGSHGINAMWTAATFGPDLTAGFSFDRIAGCKQTKNATLSGCMAAPGCLVP